VQQGFRFAEMLKSMVRHHKVPFAVNLKDAALQ
jgi:hypothetical protein